MIVNFGLVRPLSLASHYNLTTIYLLATRSRIHDSIYDTWNTQYIVIGSDSDSERGSDMLPGTDSDEDANNELASSLVDLSLDLAVKRTPSAQLSKICVSSSYYHSCSYIEKRARMILSSPESSSGQQAPRKKLRDGSSNCFCIVILISSFRSRSISSCSPFSGTCRSEAIPR